MASQNFTSLPLHLANADLDFGADTFKALIVSSVPTEANLDDWVDRADVTNEITDADYTAGGFNVTAAVGAIDTTNNRVPVTFSAADPTYTSVSISGVGCVIYKSTGVSANDLLVGFVDWNGTVTSTAANFTVSFDTPLYINAGV